MWGEWIRIHHAQPAVGEYIQMEYNCGFCGNSPLVLEGFYGTDTPKYISGDEPCDRRAERWRKLKPNAKEKAVERQAVLS
jgi:hypothetical protein